MNISISFQEVESFHNLKQIDLKLRRSEERHDNFTTSLTSDIINCKLQNKTINSKQYCGYCEFEHISIKKKKKFETNSLLISDWRMARLNLFISLFPRESSPRGNLSPFNSSTNFLNKQENK
jgi:hypothetical protein